LGSAGDSSLDSAGFLSSLSDVFTSQRARRAGAFFTGDGDLDPLGSSPLGEYLSEPAVFFGDGFLARGGDADAERCLTFLAGGGGGGFSSALDSESDFGFRLAGLEPDWDLILGGDRESDFARLFFCGDLDFCCLLGDGCLCGDLDLSCLLGDFSRLLGDGCLSLDLGTSLLTTFLSGDSSRLSTALRWGELELDRRTTRRLGGGDSELFFITVRLGDLELFLTIVLLGDLDGDFFTILLGEFDRDLGISPDS
jgi:hypothetical protein